MIYWIALSIVEGLGLATKHKLLQKFGTPEDIFEQKISKKEFPHIKNDIDFTKIRDNSLAAAERIESFCQRENVEVLSLDGSEYPSLLKKINQVPLVLFCKGDTKILSDRAVGIVGTREPNRNGEQDTKEISTGLARSGFVIVSGLARGVDTIAHNSALSINGGKTVAVMATGINEITPSQNFGLAQKIIENGGAIITEQVPGKMAFAPNFVSRNRIISGLSECTIVISAPEKSGALRTAEFALTQGRKCLVAPGQRNDERYDGSNKLLLQKTVSPALKLSSILSYINENDTAKIEQLGIFNAATSTFKPPLQKLKSPKIEQEAKQRLHSQSEQNLLSFLSKNPISIEELSAKSGMDITLLSETLFDLELEGAVSADFSGNYYK